MTALLGNQRGSVLALTFLALLLLSALALSLGTISLANWESADRDDTLILSNYVARAGMEQSCQSLLLANSDWSTIPVGPVSTGVVFSGGNYDVLVNASATNSIFLQVDARIGEVLTSLEFQLQRLTSAGGGSGPTTGVKIVDVRDLVLEATFG